MSDYSSSTVLSNATRSKSKFVKLAPLFNDLTLWNSTQYLRVIILSCSGVSFSAFRSLGNPSSFSVSAPHRDFFFFLPSSPTEQTWYIGISTNIIAFNKIYENWRAYSPELPGKELKLTSATRFIWWARTCSRGKEGRTDFCVRLLGHDHETVV
jgi:hypothetical protein